MVNELFYEDPYGKEFSAEIVDIGSVDGELVLSLEKRFFILREVVSLLIGVSYGIMMLV